MAKKLQTPCSAPKRGLPCEIKLDYALGGYAGIVKAFLYVIREEYGAAAALKIYARVNKIDDRIKRFVNTLLTIFKIEGNDCETIGQWLDVFAGLLTGQEVTILERSKTIERRKITKCLWKTEPKDLSDWNLPFVNLVAKTINPKATVDRPKGMCAGDPSCEYIYKVEE
jgi:hypothetical protein